MCLQALWDTVSGTLRSLQRRGGSFPDRPYLALQDLRSERQRQPEIPGGPVWTHGLYTEGEARHPHPVPNPGLEGRAGLTGPPTPSVCFGVSSAYQGPPMDLGLPSEDTPRFPGGMVESQAELGCRRSRLGGEAPGFCTGEDAFDSEKQTGRGLNRGLFPLHGDVSGGGSAAPGCHPGPALASLHLWHPTSFPRLSCLACFSQWQSGCCRSSVPWTGQEEGEGPRDNPLFCLADVCVGSH